nr:uncharacterized protein LOC109158503 [Ipomoea batatas]
MKVQNLGCRFAVDLIYYAALNLQKAVVIEEDDPREPSLLRPSESGEEEGGKAFSLLFSLSKKSEKIAGEMLSGTSTGSPATRSLEDQDLLERSTKKSKTGEIEMENSSNIDVDLEMGQEGGLEATTQTANEKMNAHGVVNMGNGEGSRERENGFKFQVSYKNVVAAIERNSSELHEEGGAGVNTTSTSYGKDRTLIDKVLPLQRPEASETFGPWMIAKKPARRNSRNNGMVTGKGNGSRIKEHNEKIGESSRFAVLEEETGEDIENIDYEQTHHNELNSKKKGKQPMSKGRRPNVQVSEINNIANKGISIKADNQGNQHKSSTSHDGSMNAKGGRPNQAAALDEHTVVRGENNGAVITSERIVHNDQDSVMLENDHNFDPGTLEANTEEHFSDPPTTTNDIADDFVDGDECWEGASESLHEEMDLTV